MHLLAPTPTNIQAAADIIRAGGLVAMPTETVYGLAADAQNARAVASVYERKNRPAFNPLICHVDSLEMAERIAVFDDRARLVAGAFWPGPLTLVLPLRAGAGIDPLATAGLSTVTVRMPAHEVARGLITAVGRPLVAPSANRSGRLSPTTPAHVAQSLGDDLTILAAGPTPVGVESTILDLTSDPPVILRAGGITPEDLVPVLGLCPALAAGTPGTKPKAAGMTAWHYAPSLPVRLRAVDVAPDEALLAFGSTRFMGVRGGGFVHDLPDGQVLNLSESGDLVEAAANLFRMMHDLDRPAYRGIAVMDVPDVGIGIAINDRLKRAALYDKAVA